MKHRVGYFSSYDRGLFLLLKLWPEIRKQVPKATLTIAYGWDMYLNVRGKDQYYEYVCRQLEDLKDQGVTELGRLSHTELAKLMKKTDVLAYPTEWTETFMITMIKCLASGVYPVSTGVAAMQETQGGFGTTIDCLNIYSNEWAQSKFVKEVVKALKNSDKYDPKPAIEFSKQFYWENIATKWLEVINAR